MHILSIDFTRLERFLISTSDITRVIAFHNILVRESIHSFTYMFISPFSIYSKTIIFLAFHWQKKFPN